MLLGCYSSGVRKKVRIQPFHDQGEVTVQTAEWGPKIRPGLFSDQYCTRAGLHTVSTEQVVLLVDVCYSSGCLCARVEHTSTHDGVLIIATPTTTIWRLSNFSIVCIHVLV